MPELSIARIRDATRGDRRAVREIVNELAPVVHYRVARALMRQRGTDRDVRREAEDIIQSVFLFLFGDTASVLRHWHPVRGASLSDYLALIVEREVVSILRTRGWSPWGRDPARSGDVEGSPTFEPTGGARLGSRKTLRLVLDRMQARLSDRDLDLFQLLAIEERPVVEICAVMGMSPEAVYRARSRLARLVGEIAAEILPEAEAEPCSTILPLEAKGDESIPRQA